MMIDGTSALMAQAQTSAQASKASSIASQASGLGNGKHKTLAQAQEAGKQFESMFLSQMMSHMFEGIETDPNFGGGHGETMFRSMLVDQYAQKMTNAGGVGIADAVTREILKTQGA
ncbi:rod-binding protein [uncultured Thalassospira sp.]|jgi:Rod binding domain-containing protein|uniref:rod-binding protein n=1 Tax=uncultured Thalassospira sp. TaxID=404382 RepID=UPI0030DC441D|tara:strand:+ start:8242 stop:8589 length:348 start_codon:yes stop_codon:yes gene_type:complete